MTQPNGHVSANGASTESPAWRGAMDGNRASDGTENLAQALGWFSLGLGAAGILAPSGVARFIGVSDDDRSRDVLRAIGAREVVAGLGILSQKRPAGWVWSRVAGDLMDLALLGKAMTQPDSSRGRLAATTAVIAGVTAIDLVTSQKLNLQRTESQRPGQSGSRRARAITIYKSVEEVYAFWRQLENLPRFMKHLQMVREIDDRRSHWVAEGPAGSLLEWDAEIVEERPNELIAWRSFGGSGVQHEGQVRFQAARNRPGTEVHVEMDVHVPGGAAGETLAKMFGKDPGQELANDLRTFKQILETGVDVISEGTVGWGNKFPQHSAQPAAESVAA